MSKTKTEKSSHPQKVFPDLPAELKLAIWDFAAFAHPRIINVRTSNLSPGQFPSFNYTRTPLPSIFFICHDSREAAKRQYKTPFKDLLSGQAGIRYNPSIDILLFGCLNWDGCQDFTLFMKNSLKEELEDVQHLAVAYKTRAWPWKCPSVVPFLKLKNFYRIYYEDLFNGSPQTLPSDLGYDPPPNLFHQPRHFKQNGHNKFDHLLTLEELTTTENDSSIPDPARESYRHPGIVLRELVEMTIIFDRVEKKNPNWKRPVLRAGHLTVDESPFCHSYKDRITLVPES